MRSLLEIWLQYYHRSSHQRYSVKMVFLEISQNSQENTSARVSFLIKLQAVGLAQTLAQVFSSEFCAISKYSFFHRTLLVAVSVTTTKLKY